jgi:excisionase family DNA binding protein
VDTPLTTPLNRPPLPKLLTVTEVGEWLLLTPRQVTRLAKRGEIPSIAVPGGDLMFEAADLIEWLATLRSGGSPREPARA